MIHRAGIALHEAGRAVLCGLSKLALFDNLTREQRGNAENPAGARMA